MVTKPEVRRAAATVTRRKGDIGVTDASKPSPKPVGPWWGMQWQLEPQKRQRRDRFAAQSRERREIPYFLPFF